MDAFSMLAAAMPADAGADDGRDPAKLISFFAQEMQLFFAHIQDAVVAYSGSGELPHSLFTKKALKAAEKAAGKGKRGRGKAAGGEKRKRKPSAFNLFVQEKMKELKAAGVKPPEEMAQLKNPLFTMAAKEWGKLSEEGKKAYASKVAPLIEAMADPAGDAGGAAAAAAAAGAVKEEDEEEEEEDEEDEEEGGSDEGSEEEEEESSSEEEEEPPKKPAPPPASNSQKKKKHKHNH